jgi:hypothetical protein
MTPLDLLARLAALIPPPRHPLIQFHGVFAPSSSWRTSVVPMTAPHDGSATCPCDACGDAERGATHARRDDPLSDAASKPTQPSTPPTASDDVGLQSDAELKPTQASTQPTASDDVRLESDSQGARKKSWWIDWATLLRRVYDVNALACRCGGRLRFVEVVTERKHARAHLERLGVESLDATPPPIAADARDPAAAFIDPPSCDW